MLLFKKKFLESIRSGEKTQTIRIWPHRKMKVGQRSYIPGIGYIRVGAVDAVDLAELTDNDGLRDGFHSAADLRAEIHRLYPEGLIGGLQTYRVRFHVLCDSEQHAAIAERKERKAATDR